MPCLFCESDGPFTIEHIIPESLGNDDLLLQNQVCAGCNNHFSKLEEYVLQKTSFAFWRAQLGIRSKKGKLPSVNLSQPKRGKGTFPCKHKYHDDGIGFTSHEDGSTSIEIDDSSIIKGILDGERTEFRFVMTPAILFGMGRFLCKVGIELLCLDNQDMARSTRFEHARHFARYGSVKNLWPIFHFTNGNLSDFRRLQVDFDGLFEEVDCYAYRILEIAERYCLIHLQVGTDNWVVCLNDPFPTPEINMAFPGQKIQCIWYSPKEMG